MFLQIEKIKILFWQVQVDSTTEGLILIFLKFGRLTVSEYDSSYQHPCFPFMYVSVAFPFHYIPVVLLFFPLMLLPICIFQLISVVALSTAVKQSSNIV